METMYIGSGDTAALLSGLNTETHYKLLRRFVSGVKPYFNAKHCGIEAFETGAILEDRYYLTLPDGYFTQVKCICKEMDVLKSSLDFAKFEAGIVVDFDELKSCNFNDFLNLEPFRSDNSAGIAYIAKHYSKYYNQVQHQLLCTGLQSANLVFLAVYNYDRLTNETRNIEPNECIKFRIYRDQKVIDTIIGRAKIFQQIKDAYTK